MSYKNKPQNVKSPYSSIKDMADDEVTLKIIEIIESTPKISQSKITKQTGLAAGLVHSFMRRIISKGWIRAKQVSSKRWLYFLTPDGFSEKSRLSMNFLKRTLGTYRIAQNVVSEKLNICQAEGCERLVVAGDNELAEITTLNIKAMDNFILSGVITGLREGELLVGEKMVSYENVRYMDFDRIFVCDTGFSDWHTKSGNFIDNQRLVFLLYMSIVEKRQAT